MISSDFHSSVVCISCETGEPTECPADTVLCLGTFDGVHLGHQALARETVRLAEEQNATPGAWFFSAPPAQYLTKTPPPLLTDKQEKRRLLAACGLRVAFLGDFPTLRSLTPAAFARALREECACRGAVCGYNFHYGANGIGDAKTLAASFPLHAVVGAVKEGEIPISSSIIRARLQAGDAEGAAAMLGRPYAMRGEVVHGKALGRTLGLPTANLTFAPGMLIPAHGIYASRVTLPDGQTALGVSNIGSRPTVDDSGRVNCETYLLDFSGDLYGKAMEVALCHYLRPEQHFANIAALTAAIRGDAAHARAYFSATMTGK